MCIFNNYLGALLIVITINQAFKL